MSANISNLVQPEQKIAKLLSLIGQPARIQILSVISQQEACVCHLEAALNLRQPSISQHLMVLRKAGLVTTRRDGRHIFYLLADPGVLLILHQAAQLAGIPPGMLIYDPSQPVRGCTCPYCNPDLDPTLVCRKNSSS